MSNHNGKKKEGHATKTLTIIYWLRVALGILAALLCVGYGVATGTINVNMMDWRIFLNGTSIALVVYWLSYYVLKWIFITKVEKPQKLLMTGIGVYFLAWLVFWILIYTIIAVQTTMSSG